MRYGNHPYQLKENQVAKQLIHVQLSFTNGSSTIPYHKKYQPLGFNERLINIPIDPERTISRLSFGISIIDTIVGIRCYDERGNKFVEKRWWDQFGHKSNEDYERTHEGNYAPDWKEWQT